jgi:hypothetical protein
MVLLSVFGMNLSSEGEKGVNVKKKSLLHQETYQNHIF